MSEGSRICPICDLVTDESMCPEDNVPTVDRKMLDQRWEDRLKPGMMIANRFRVEGFLGGGSMGGVYHCTQVNMQRPVALKTLKQEFMSDSQMLKRFYLEARAASSLDHPNIVRIYDFGVDETLEVPYIAMEFLVGDDMRTMLFHRERLPEREAAYLISQIAKALVNAHENGIVHRDLKPANIHVRKMSGGDMFCKVLDFGIAKVVHGGDESTSNLTGTGMAMGTALYMSPEQILGKPVDFRTDLYAVGCILYELCSGETPFAGEDVAVLVRHLDEAIPDLPETLVDGNAPTDAIRYMLSRLMAKKPADRPGSTANVALALECLARGEPVDMKVLLDGTLPEPDPNAENPDVVLPMGDATAATMAQGVISQEPVAASAGLAESGASPGADVAGTVAWDTADAPPPGGPLRPPSTGSRPLTGIVQSPASDTGPEAEIENEQLRELVALRDQGVLTDEEFASEKRKLLARLGGEAGGATRAVGVLGQEDGTRTIDTLPPVPDPAAPAQTGMSRQVQSKPKGSSRVMQFAAIVLTLAGVGGGYFFMQQQEDLENSRRKMNQGIQMQHPGGLAPGEATSAAEAEEAAQNQDPLQALLNGEKLKGGKTGPRMGGAARATRRKGRGPSNEPAPVVMGPDGMVKSVDVTGKIPKEAVEKLVKEASGTLTSCFAKTQTGRDAKRDLDVQVIILHTGWVASVTVKPPTPSTIAYKDCVSGELKGLKWPKSEGGAGVTAVDLVVAALKEE